MEHKFFIYLDKANKCKFLKARSLTSCFLIISFLKLEFVTVIPRSVYLIIWCENTARIMLIGYYFCNLWVKIVAEKETLKHFLTQHLYFLK